jgi:hypothetical protein
MKRRIEFLARRREFITLLGGAASQAVRLGREIEARSASSSCERPVRLRATRNMPPVIRTIVMSGLFARRQRTSM